jgi:hypothetical protein
MIKEILRNFWPLESLHCGPFFRENVKNIFLLAHSAKFLKIYHNDEICQNFKEFAHKLREVDKHLMKRVIFYTMDHFSQREPD